MNSIKRVKEIFSEMYASDITGNDLRNSHVCLGLAFVILFIDYFVDINIYNDFEIFDVLAISCSIMQFYFIYSIRKKHKAMEDFNNL
jgi:hypothetical protein